MGWIIFISIFVAYWVVGIKRMPAYYQMVYRNDREEFSLIHDVEDSQNKAAWESFGLASVWPYYEGGLWFRRHIVKVMTAEERRQKEYEQAEKIVAEYTQRKEREERETFDRELKGEK